MQASGENRQDGNGSGRDVATRKQFSFERCDLTIKHVQNNKLANADEGW